MYFGLILLATNFYVWVRTFINQETLFQSIPPYFIALEWIQHFINYVCCDWKKKVTHYKAIENLLEELTM